MSNVAPETRSVVVERRMPHPPEKIWRALTQSALLEEWLLKNDFEAVAGHRFRFQGNWGDVEGEVLSVEPNRMLSYSWGDQVLKSVVTWTLTPEENGTLVRMEQTGFPTDQPRYYGGAQAGWPRFFDNLQRLLKAME